jgi:hypothetical protein
LLVGALFAIVMLGIQGAAFSKFTRYYLPMTPFLRASGDAIFWTEMETARGFALGRVWRCASYRLWGAGCGFDLRATSLAPRGFALDFAKHRAWHPCGSRNRLGRRFADCVAKWGAQHAQFPSARNLRPRHAAKTRSDGAQTRFGGVDFSVVGPQLAEHSALAAKMADDDPVLSCAFRWKSGI